MTEISIANVSKSYDGRPVLKDVHLEIERGKTYGLAGRNGSGKSVLLKIIAGLIRPDCGSVTVQGKTLGKDMEFCSDMGILINGPAFVNHYSAIANLKLLAAYRNSIARADIERAIETVGLDPRDQRAVRKYSTGMKARLGIAQAMMENPRILLLDEPFNGLDQGGVKEMQRVIQDMKRQGKTILITSHIQSDMDLLCDRVCLVENGTVVPTDQAKFDGDYAIAKTA